MDLTDDGARVRVSLPGMRGRREVPGMTLDFVR
jgi:hypothetical protein